MRHLAIVNKKFADAILNGRKSIETRFSKHNIPPFGRVSVGDIVYLKISGGEIVGQYRVKKVFYYQGITPTDFDKIFVEFGKFILSGDKSQDQQYMEEKRGSMFGTLIFIGESERFITSPIKVKKGDQRGWMILD